MGAARRDRAVADLAQMQAIDLSAPTDGEECGALAACVAAAWFACSACGAHILPWLMPMP